MSRWSPASALLILALIFAVDTVTTPSPSPQQGTAELSPQQFLEQLLFVVAPIEQWCGPSRLGTATGFFFVNEERLYFVTNRHVVRDEEHRLYPDKLRLRLHTNVQDHTQNDNYDISLYRNGISVWREKPGLDLAAIEIPRNDVERFVIKALPPSLFAPTDLVIGPGDDVIIIGYPRGFSDTLHNYPVIRVGAVASAYPTPFQGKPLFLVDARLHPGTSGSPVLAKPSTTWRTLQGTSVTGLSTFFLGVNSGEFFFGGESLGLNGIWYAAEVQAITISSFRTASFPQQ